MQAIFTAPTYQIRSSLPATRAAIARRSGLGELLEALEGRAEIGALGEDRRARVVRPAAHAIERIAQVEPLGVEPGDDLVPGERHRDRRAADRAHAERRDEQLAVRVLAPVEVDPAAARGGVARGGRHVGVLALDELAD